MHRIHRIIGEGLIECAGAPQHFLLGCSPVQEPATGLDAIGEIQGQWSQALGNEASCRTERGLIGDLDRGFCERASLV